MYSPDHFCASAASTPQNRGRSVRALEVNSLTNSVVVLSGKTPAPSENNARKIAEFLGAEVTLVSVATACDIESVKQLVPPCTAVIVHADTLVEMAEVLGAGVNGLLALVDLAAHIFAYGFQATDRHASILTALSSGGLLRLEPLPKANSAFIVSDRDRESCGQFSGLSVQVADRTRDACFVEGRPRDGQTALIQAAGQPFFVRVDHGKSELFFVACSELGNLDELIPSKTGLLPWFSRVVPLIIFLRSALGNHIWHSDRSQACFIIDDPLLKQQYGFLNYSRLLETMGEQRFCACIAFIPWNYRRSRKQVARMFSTVPSPLSLCIHGCDHTRGEFASPGYEVLRDKARLALDRMQLHSELSGVPFADVMVFPQGLFSTEAIKALEACGYLAAVNTNPCPSNKPDALTLRDLLDVAVTRFEGFPVFARHYPRDPAEFAYDLFLGKPALVVEHHGYFRNGYKELETFVKRLDELDNGLEWHDLANIFSQTCLKKVMPNGDVHIRFYTHRFRLTNSGARSETYVLFRRWISEGQLPSVTLNGREWMRERTDDSLSITLSLDPGETADIRIFSKCAAGTSTVSWKPTKTHNARVFARRVLCEFRDDHVETNGLISGLISNVRKLRVRNTQVQTGFAGDKN
jgi:hypothetical protein